MDQLVKINLSLIGVKQTLLKEEMDRQQFSILLMKRWEMINSNNIYQSEKINCKVYKK
jgi:hypothetical protein